VTVSSLSNKVVIAGNGSTTVFSYNFQINNATDCQVIYTDATGTSTTLSSTLYTITGLGVPTGGTVTYNPGTPIASGTSLTITRQLALTQPTSIQNQGAFYPSAVEAAIDRAVMEVQQVSEQIGRTITGPITDSVAMSPLPSATLRANKSLIFDALGNPTAGSFPASGVISAAMSPVVSASSLAAGRIALGLGGLAVEGIGKGLQDDGAGNARVNFITESKAVNYLVATTDHGERYIVTGPITFTLPATSTLWNGFEFMVDVYGTSGTLILTPNSADSIEGNGSGISSYVPSGAKAYICTNGAGAWYVRRTRSYQSAMTPGGYLSPTSFDPSNMFDVISATTLYYNTDVHGFIPIYNGAEWIEYPIYNMSCALNAAQQGAYYVCDVYAFIVNGQPTLGIGPGWRNSGYGLGIGGFTSVTNATPIVVTASGHNLVNGDIVTITGVDGNTGANGRWTVSGVAGTAFTLTGSIGNGAYVAGTGTFSSRGATLEITRSGGSGLWVNASGLTIYNGTTPYSVGAGSATYLGSILIDSVAGQFTCHRLLGQSRNMGLWNAYNRKNISLMVRDPTPSWNYNSGTIRASNNAIANSLRYVIGIAEEPVNFTFYQNAVAPSCLAINAIGYANVVSNSGFFGSISLATGTTTSTNMVASYTVAPTWGMVAVVALEAGSAGNPTFYGGKQNMLLTANYRG